MKMILEGVKQSIMLSLIESSITVLSAYTDDEILYTLEIKITEDVMLLTNGENVILYYERTANNLPAKTLVLNKNDFVSITLR